MPIGAPTNKQEMEIEIFRDCKSVSFVKAIYLFSAREKSALEGEREREREREREGGREKERERKQQSNKTLLASLPLVAHKYALCLLEKGENQGGRMW